MVKSFSKKQIEHIQYDESVIFLDYGLETERYLAPTRGGGEFTANCTIHDIEFDGKQGKTAGTQIIEEQEAVTKVTTLCISPENLKLAIPGAEIEQDNKGNTFIENPSNGLIPDTAYFKNITQFCKLLNGKHVKITLFNPMSENGLSIKAQSKAEGELALEIYAHHELSDLNKKGGLWRVTWLKEAPELHYDKDGFAEAAPASEAQTMSVKSATAQAGDDKSTETPADS